MTIQLEPLSKTYYSQGLKLHYLDWGNTGAPMLIFVHGMNDHAHSWDWVAREMCAKWHVIAVDLRGHGDSEWSVNGAYHNPYYLLDIVDLVDALAAEPVTIVAHSLGGNPSARFAALYPQRIRQLVLVDAMGPNATVMAQWEKQGIVNRSRDWLEKRQATVAKSPRRFATLDIAITRMAKANKHLSPEQAQHLTTHGVRQYKDGYGWKHDPLIGNFLPEDFAINLAEYWQEISTDTLICWGSDSWTSNPATDGSAAHFHNCQTITFKNAGHWLHHDQLDAFVTTLQQFLHEE